MFVLAAMAVGTLVSAAAGSAAQKKQGKQQQLQKYTEAAYSDFEAKQVKDASIAQADKILAAAQYVRGTQATQQAASGVVIGEGSAGVMSQDTQKRASADALVALYNGGRQSSSMETSGQYNRSAGDNAYTSGIAQGNATMIAGVASAATSAYSGYKQNLISTKKT